MPTRREAGEIVLLSEVRGNSPVLSHWSRNMPQMHGIRHTVGVRHPNHRDRSRAPPRLVTPAAVARWTASAARRNTVAGDFRRLFGCGNEYPRFVEPTGRRRLERASQAGRQARHRRQPGWRLCAACDGTQRSFRLVHEPRLTASAVDRRALQGFLSSILPESACWERAAGGGLRRAANGIRISLLAPAISSHYTYW
jgi:hypothetical protein